MRWEDLMVRGKASGLPPMANHKRRGVPSRKNTAQVQVPEGYLATSEAARRLGVVHGTILYRIGRGQIRAETVMVPALLIPEMEIQNLLDAAEAEEEV